MESQVQYVLERYVDDLEAEFREAGEILDRLGRAQLLLRRAEPVAHANPQSQAPRTWLMYYEPESHLRERFDLAPELLVLLISSRQAQARDIQQAERALLRDYRLDRGLVLVIAQDQGVHVRLEQAARQTGRTYVLLSLAEVEKVADPQQWLRGLLLESLGSSNLFAAGRPVFGWDFMGRKKELQLIRRHLETGRPIGLYGLRKIGKTSVLLHIRKQLIAESGAAHADDGEEKAVIVPIHMDLQAISLSEWSRPGFMRRLIRSTYETLKELGIDPASVELEPELGALKHLRKLEGEQVERAGTDMLEMLIGWAQEAPAQRRILIFIDEYERLFGKDGFRLSDGLDILVYLRGLVQTYPETFNFLIAGLSRQFASKSSFIERQNPLFDFMVDFPLAGLPEQEMKELVRKIGRRLSLDFDAEALSLIWNETGGHPYLAREFGRIIDRSVPIRKRTQSKPITRDMALGVRDEFRREVATTMEEMGRAISELDANAPFTLSYLHATPAEADTALAVLRPEIVDELQRLGILERNNGMWRIRIGCFGAWLRDNWERSLPAAVSG